MCTTNQYILECVYRRSYILVLLRLLNMLVVVCIARDLELIYLFSEKKRSRFLLLPLAAVVQIFCKMSLKILQPFVNKVTI